MTSYGFQIDSRPPSVEFKDFEKIITSSIPQKGSSRLYVGSKYPPLGYAWIGSEFLLGVPGDQYATDGELVKIIRRRSGYIYLDRPFARTWHGEAVIPLDVPIIPELTLDGGKGQISVSLCARLTLRNWTVQGYNGRGISIQGSRDVTIQRCSASDPVETGPGQGYGVQLQRCTHAELDGITGTANRHLPSLFATASGVLRNIRASQSVGSSLDCHWECEDILFENCTADKNISIGNRYGSNHVQLKNCTGEMLRVQGPGIVEASFCAFSGPLGLGKNAEGIPGRVSLRSTSLGRYSTTGSVVNEDRLCGDTVIEMDARSVIRYNQT